MSRTNMLLVFVGAGVVAIVAGVITAFVVAGRAHDDTRQHERAAADAIATSFVETHGIKTSTPIETLATPIPIESLHPVTLMFCEPLQQGGQGAAAGNSTKVAVVPDGTHIFYKPGTCDPVIDADGMVATDTGPSQPGQDACASCVRVKPSYVSVDSLHSAQFEEVIWTPARGDLNGVPTIMTGRHLKRDAQVRFDALNSPILTLDTTDEGQQIFGSITEKMIGLPLATFIDGEPIRGQHGQILAPTVQAKITDSIWTTGLSLDDAKRIAALINNGLAQ